MQKKWLLIPIPSLLHCEVFEKLLDLFRPWLPRLKSGVSRTSVSNSCHNSHCLPFRVCGRLMNRSKHYLPLSLNLNSELLSKRCSIWPPPKWFEVGSSNEWFLSPALDLQWEQDMTLVITQFNSFILQMQNLRPREENNMPAGTGLVSGRPGCVPFIPQSQNGMTPGLKLRSSNSKSAPST